MDGFISVLRNGFIQTGFLFTLILIFTSALVAVRRLFFHPLSNFPGPRIAGTTCFYKIYYEVFKRGDFLQKIHHLHSEYGPVVRIGPNELHFNDYHAYFNIYSVGSHVTKDPDFYNCFGVDGSAFGAIDSYISKGRRGTMHPLFSRRVVLELECLIQKKVEFLVWKLKGARGNPTNMFLAFRSASLDIITTYMFGHCLDTLNFPNFEAPLVMNIQAALPLLWTIKAFPWIISILSILPRRLGGHLSRQFYAFLSIRETTMCLLDHTREDSIVCPDSTRFTIYHSLVNSSDKPLRHQSTSHSVLDEALSLLQAGSDTVGNTCTVGTFYLLHNRAAHSRLVDELQSRWPDQNETISLSTLQHFPYLTAVIKEALRLSHGIVTPLPRMVNSTGATISGYHIPPNTVVGMSVTAIHLNEALFPNPTVFDPDRWLSPTSHELGRYLVPFSTGPRMCLGIRYDPAMNYTIDKLTFTSIAWAELYLFFAHIFRKLDMQILNTDNSVNDPQTFKDYFVPLHEGGHLHVRAKQRH